MITDGSLILDIALGILVGDLLRVMVKDTRTWWKERRANSGKVANTEAEDWNFLWDNVPESAKEEMRRFIEDEQLRRRAQELNLWPHLWSAAPEETKEKLRTRWKVARVPPKVTACESCGEEKYIAEGQTVCDECQSGGGKIRSKRKLK